MKIDVTAPGTLMESTDKIRLLFCGNSLLRSGLSNEAFCVKRTALTPDREQSQ